MCSASTFEERSRALAACAAHGYISSQMDTPLRLRISTVVACSAGFDRAAGLGSAGAIWFACFRCLCRCSNNAARDLNPIGRQPNVARQTIHSSQECSRSPPGPGGPTHLTRPPAATPQRLSYSPPPCRAISAVVIPSSHHTRHASSPVCYPLPPPLRKRLERALLSFGGGPEPPPPRGAPW